MDPLAHTLVGAALGRAVAGRDLPAAGWIGAIAANAPDWSELVLKPDLWPPRAGGEYLVLHRGITHSFVGAAVERSEERRVGKECRSRWSAEQLKKKNRQ